MIEDLLKAIASEIAEKERPKPSPAEQVGRLKTFAAQYAAGVTFQVGDLVTPKKGVNLKWRGEPHIVVDVRSNAEPVFEGEKDSTRFGVRPNLRVARLTASGETLMFWGEAVLYELYRPSAEKADHVATPD